jgi:hypothetical protein
MFLQIPMRLAAFLLGIIYEPEYGSTLFLRNVGGL